MRQFEHIDIREGYWKIDVYLDGECIHSFDDNSGDIYADLRDFPDDGESSLLDELIGEIQQTLMTSRRSILSEEEIEALKRKMIDVDNWKND